MIAENNIFIDIIKVGGIPALSIFVCFLILMAYIKMRTKTDAVEKEEREQRDKRQTDQYNNLMEAYAELVEKFVALSVKTTEEITSLKDLISKCPINMQHGPFIVKPKNENHNESGK